MGYSIKQEVETVLYNFFSTQAKVMENILTSIKNKI